MKAMTRRKFALAAQQKLQKAALQIIQSAGAMPTPDAMYHYSMLTKYGKLGLSLDCGHYLFTVFCRFEEPERANEILKNGQGNTYSGKWNFHVGRTDEPQSWLDYFRSSIDRVKV